LNDPQASFDLFVIGGGINGVGIANDAAGRGIKVGLCEMNDLGSATSSGSSKLIHGGLRYLEYLEFRLVKEALKEREILIKKAPHLVTPLRFILPYQPGIRPAWLIKAGLYLYDHLSKLVTLKESEAITFDENSPLYSKYQKGFEYSDAFADDARLVITNAIQARDNGAVIMVRHKCIATRRYSSFWEVELLNIDTKQIKTIRTKVLINASGPWVSQFLDQQVQLHHQKNITLVQGSHIITKRLHSGDEAFILQNDDLRIIFVIPYLDDYSLIGTTDKIFTGDPSKAEITEEEIGYLLNAVNKYFKDSISAQNIISSYSAIRPLMEEEENNPQAITRDYSFELDQHNSMAPLLSIFGGKLTTYRKLAEAALTQLNNQFPNMAANWTQHTALPGAEYSSLEQLKTDLSKAYPWLSDSLIRRYIQNYGSLSWTVLQPAKSADDMGINFGFELYQIEVDYLIHHEWARTAEDILKRRTKLYLKLDKPAVINLENYINAATRKIIQ